MTDDPTIAPDSEMAEITAIGAVFTALKALKKEEQLRVIDYVARKLGIASSAVTPSAWSVPGTISAPESAIESRSAVDDSSEASDTAGGTLDGISGIAQKWIKRSSLTEDGLSAIFSLQLDDIDLIAESVPGKSGKEKLRSVVLLRGIAGYLSSGAARFSYEKLRETALHYGAWDNTNVATYMRSFVGDVTGGRESGYTLTPRGLAAATKLVRSMTTKQGT